VSEISLSALIICYFCGFWCKQRNKGHKKVVIGQMLRNVTSKGFYISIDLRGVNMLK
jgi:MinD superfamily P-loop ATPase